LKVNLRPLKQFALEKLPKDWPLREAILVEDDQMPAAELPGRARIWLALLRHARSDYENKKKEGGN